MLEFKEENHEYFWNGVKVPSVSNIIAPLRDFSKIPPDVLETKKEWGKAVHLYTAMHDQETLDPDHSKWDARMIPIVEAWQRFKEQFGLGTECFIEKPMYSETYRFAGTPDRVYDNIIVDIKTATAHHKSSGVQLSAYAHLADFTDCRLIECCLIDDGTYKVKMYGQEENWNTFQCCLHIFNFRGGK